LGNLSKVDITLTSSIIIITKLLNYANFSFFFSFSLPIQKYDRVERQRRQSREVRRHLRNVMDKLHCNHSSHVRQFCEISNKKAIHHNNTKRGEKKKRVQNLTTMKGEFQWNIMKIRLRRNAPFRLHENEFDFDIQFFFFFYYFLLQQYKNIAIFETRTLNTLSKIDRGHHH
jgi:hypothetical protein